MASTTLEVIISATDKFSGTAAKVVGGLTSINSASGRTAKGIGQVAGGLTRLGIVAVAAAGAGLTYVAKQALSWESALAGVNKTVEFTSTDGLPRMGRAIRDLATDIPIAATEIARLAETAGALGIQEDSILSFARVTAELGITTNVSADQAATSLGVLSNVLKLTADDYERFGSTLVDLGNKGASTESDILGIAERAGAAGALINLSADQVLGFSSAVANLGIEVEAGGTSLQRFFLESLSAVADGGAELKLFAATAGVSAKDFAAYFKKDAAGALGAFIEGLGELDETARLQVLKALNLDDVRIGRMLLGLAGNTDNLTNSLGIANAAWDANTALSVEAQKRYDTVASKLAVLKNNFIEAAIRIGEGFTPALGRMAERLSAFLKVNGSELTAFGEDIGKALDGLDFDDLLDTVKDLARIFREDVIPAIRIGLDLFRSLPGPVQGLGAALAIGANTPIVGGALASIGRGVGNIGMGILGGIGAAATRGTAVGGLAARAFAQPVFVTNWPPTLGAGGAGPGGVVGAGRNILGGLLGAGAILAIGGAIGSAIVEAAGGPNGGLGRKVGNIAGADILVGQSMAGAAPSHQAANKVGGTLRSPLPVSVVSDPASSHNTYLANQNATANFNRVYDALERNRLALASLPAPIVNVDVDVTARSITRQQTHVSRVTNATHIGGV